MGGTFSYTEFSVESRVDVKIYFLVACRTLGYIDTLFCNQRVEYVAFAKYLRSQNCRRILFFCPKLAIDG